MMAKLNFHHHNYSLQCHMIFRNHSNADLVLITSVENGAANIFVEVVIHVLMNKKYNRTAFI